MEKSFEERLAELINNELAKPEGGASQDDVEGFLDEASKQVRIHGAYNP